MDKRRGFLNITVSIISKLLLLVTALIVRRLLIQYIGNEANGLNSLYTNIIGMLAVAELGIGSAITYSMYKPIVEGDKKKTAALYCLYKRLYWMIGSVILIAGLGVMPFLPALISDYESISDDVRLTYFLALISVVLTYLYSAKTSLINAYKDNYITTGILTISRLITYGLQIAAILIWHSFVIFLICQIIETMVAWLLTEVVVRRKHGDVIERRETVDKDTKAEITRNVKAMMMHKVGTAMVKTVDSLIISGFIGVIILGKYSNYSYIASVLAGILTLFFTPLTSVIGHLCVEGNPEKIKNFFNHFYCLNYILGVVFFLGYYAVVDSVVEMLFGAGLEMSRAIAFIITLNQFTAYMRQTSLLFRNASGTFYNDRWKPIAEGVVNLGLSLLFVIIFPDDYKVVGVIVATIITTLLICYTVEPYVIYKHVFGKSAKEFYIRNYIYVGPFISALFLLNILIRPAEGAANGILVNGFISVGLSAVVLGLLMLVDKKFRFEAQFLSKEGISWSGRVLRGSA